MADIPVSAFGARLKAAREARGISLAHIATVTKISVRALEAVERNDFSRLPGGIFTRAFVRAYAGEVGLDPEEALRSFLDQCPREAAAVPTATPESIEGTGRPEWQEKLSWRQAALAVAVVAAVALAGYLLVTRVVRPAPAVVDPPSSAPTTPSPIGSTGASPARIPTTRPASASQRERLTAVPAALPVAAGAAGSVVTPLVVELAVTGPCWISATADRRAPAARLFAAGERSEIHADRHVGLKIGDAAAVSMTVNGRAAGALGAPGRVANVRIAAGTPAPVIQIR